MTEHKNQQDPTMLNDDTFWFKTDTSLKNSINHYTPDISLKISKLKEISKQNSTCSSRK